MVKPIKIPQTTNLNPPEAERPVITSFFIAKPKISPASLIILALIIIISPLYKSTVWGTEGQITITNPPPDQIFKTTGAFYIEGTYIVTVDDTPTGYAPEGDPRNRCRYGDVRFSPNFHDSAWATSTYAAARYKIDDIYGGHLGYIQSGGSWSEIGKTKTFKTYINTTGLTQGALHIVTIYLQDVGGGWCYRSADPYWIWGEIFKEATLNFIKCGSTEICGDGIDNNCDGQVDEGCTQCVVDVNASPSEVWPQNTGSSDITSTITVSLAEPAPSEGCEVNFTVEPFNLSGGHVHYGNRPKGTITDSTGNTISSITLSNAENSAMVKYTSSEISGEEKIKIKLNGEDAGETMIRVRVPGLEGMPQSGIGAWRLTGSYGEPGVTSQHFENHYGTPSAKARIAAMATDYFEETGIAIGINDMSLPWGGLFDIENNWSTPHSRHRTGKSVDIDHLGVQEDKLDEIAEENYECERREVDRIHYECP